MLIRIMVGLFVLTLGWSHAFALPILVGPTLEVVVAGEELEVVIEIGTDADPAVSLFGVGLAVGFDEAVFEPLGAGAGDFFPAQQSLFFSRLEDEAASYAVSASLTSGEGLAGSGVMAILRFRVRDEAPGGTYSFVPVRIAATDALGRSLSTAAIVVPVSVGGIPTGACCAIDGSCTIAAAVTCAGAYQGDNTTCDPNPCPPPPPLDGACCAINGSCTVTTQSGCVGAYRGDNTACDPNPCPQPTTGACCLRLGGACRVLAPASCAGFRGTFMGLGTTCAPNPCRSSTGDAEESGACCLDSRDCIVLVDEECLRFGGTFLGGASTCSPELCETSSIHLSSWGAIKTGFR